MPTKKSETTRSDRRGVVKAGAGIAATIAGASFASRAIAHEASPTPSGRDLVGHFGVTRSYTVKVDADVHELIAKVQGFVEIISAVEGFAAYTIIYGDENRIWTAVSIFDNPDSAQASTGAAADYVTENDLGGYFEDPRPAVVDGDVMIAAGY